MAVIYPIDDYEYTAADVEIFNCTRTSGVYERLNFPCSVSGVTATIGAGLAWIRNSDFSGKAIAFPETTKLTFSAADASNDRYDIIAISYQSDKKKPEIIIKKGAATASPEYPTRSVLASNYELFLYAVLRKKGETSINTANIIDLRENEKYCGIMQDSITSAVQPAYDTFFEGHIGVGDTVDFNASEYQYLIATLYYTVGACDVILTRTSDPLEIGNNDCFTGINTFKRKTSNSGDKTYFYRVQINLNTGFTTGHTVTVAQVSETADFDDGKTYIGYVSKLVGVTKTPKGFVRADVFEDVIKKTNEKENFVRFVDDKNTMQIKLDEDGGVRLVIKEREAE